MKTTFDKNAEKYVELVVEKMQSLTIDWNKPWFPIVNTRRNFLPQNLTGRAYSGGNAFLLFFLCEKYNYQTPVFLTFKQAKDEGLSILKGSKSFPVYYPVFCAYHNETNEKLSYEEYKKLSREEQKECRLFFCGNKYYAVFNLDQTNFSDIYPDRWDILKDNFTIAQGKNETQEDTYKNDLLDKMLETQSWVCPISTLPSDRAYYNISGDNITIPLKSQFKNGKSYYCTLLHEMAHSTGIKERLNRKGFYENDIVNYGREELVAELTAAFSALYFGISTSIREENTAYLKTWCKEIKEKPNFLFTVLSDVKKATNFITEKLNISIENIDDMQEQSVA